MPRPGCGAGPDRRRLRIGRTGRAAPSRSASGDPVTVTLTCDTGNIEAPCAFGPAEVTIPAGTAVRWVDADATFHTVTSSASVSVRRPDGRFDAMLDRRGAEFTHVFTEPGTYPFYCQPHAEFMAGVVRVVGG